MRQRGTAATRRDRGRGRVTGLLSGGEAMAIGLGASLPRARGPAGDELCAEKLDGRKRGIERSARHVKAAVPPHCGKAERDR